MDDDALIDTLLRLSPLNADPGDGIAQFELNIKAGGDARFTFRTGRIEIRPDRSPLTGRFRQIKNGRDQAPVR